jgi:small GTP-binding protein
MIQMKVCMLGGFAVGKTSLVARFVSSLFSDKYHSTVGVKVDKKALSVDGREATLMIWDIYGQDEFQTVQHSQLRGMSGYLLGVDGTRRATLDTARTLRDLAAQVAGDVPFVVVLNKSDLAADWEIDDVAVFKLAEQGGRVLRASAKTGDGVEDAFEMLTRAMLDARATI